MTDRERLARRLYALLENDDRRLKNAPDDEWWESATAIERKRCRRLADLILPVLFSPGDSVDRAEHQDAVKRVWG